MAADHGASFCSCLCVCIAGAPPNPTDKFCENLPNCHEMWKNQYPHAEEVIEETSLFTTKDDSWRTYCELSPFIVFTALPDIKYLQEITRTRDAERIHRNVWTVMLSTPLDAGKQDVVGMLQEPCVTTQGKFALFAMPLNSVGNRASNGLFQCIMVFFLFFLLYGIVFSILVGATIASTCACTMTIHGLHLYLSLTIISYFFLAYRFSTSRDSSTLFGLSVMRDYFLPAHQIYSSIFEH